MKRFCFHPKRTFRPTNSNRPLLIFWAWVKNKTLCRHYRERRADMLHHRVCLIHTYIPDKCQSPAQWVSSLGLASWTRCTTNLLWPASNDQNTRSPLISLKMFILCNEGTNSLYLCSHNPVFRLACILSGHSVATECFPLTVMFICEHFASSRSVSRQAIVSFFATHHPY